NSVWPAAFGHSTLNATGGLPLMFSADTTFDTAHVGITGTTGWLVAAVILLVLIITKSFKPAPVPSIDPETAWTNDYLKIKLQPLTRAAKPCRIRKCLASACPNTSDKIRKFCRDVYGVGVPPFTCRVSPIT